ncbi:MAG TPA: DinB family protein [Myxococcaceae bacterium]|nr:DinB family protein [Myxococcaceae bacterium]
MVSLEWVHALARYNRWMNDRLYGLAASLDDDLRKRDLGAFFRSIHGTLNHLLVADRIWLGRLEGIVVPEGHMGPGGIRSLDQVLHEDFGALRQARRETDEAISAWVSGLTEARLAEPITYARRGQGQASPLWWVLAQVFNHQTHHRGQITTLLKQQGCDPGVTDLIAMLREEQRA